ncbi:hypothetical protein SeLEV6574_g05650 [Synchytrium endobioticum]|uniref:Uncharacterized protein n=1 Tax=Synchytrium endobioticum TaxID=286115 RepID=A0A507CT66_9FUNG|nr:hypothetical protein SeLEV6574_g05650 [Synchytrium endobioticum]
MGAISTMNTIVPKIHDTPAMVAPVIVNRRASAAFNTDNERKVCVVSTLCPKLSLRVPDPSTTTAPPSVHRPPFMLSRVCPLTKQQAPKIDTIKLSANQLLIFLAATICLLLGLPSSDHVSRSSNEETFRTSG